MSHPLGAGRLAGPTCLVLIPHCQVSRAGRGGLTATSSSSFGSRRCGPPAGPELAPPAPEPPPLSPLAQRGIGLETRLPARDPPCTGREELAADDLLAWRRRLLQSGGRSADLDWLLEMAGGLPWSVLQQLWLRPHYPVVLQCSRIELEAIWRAHLQGNQPLQYLVGCCPWRDMTLAVGPGVLIPRQETELMVELLLQACRPAGLEANPLQKAEDGLPPRPEPALWADLGTGSGCLAIALARAFPESTGLAVDLSGVALAQAVRNLESLGVNRQVRLLRGHWWDPLEPWWGQLDLVVANPPYIPSNVVAALDPVVRDHEPWLALDGGADGLACLRSVIHMAPRALAPGGVLLVEHHHDQSRAVLELMAAAGLRHPQAHRDLEGVPRFVSASRPCDAPGSPSGLRTTGAQAPTGLVSPEALPTSVQSWLHPPQ